VREEAAPADGVRFSSDDVLVLHAYGGAEPEDLFTRFPGQRVLYFENLTPASFSPPGSPRWRYTRETEGRIVRLAGLADLLLAPSMFNLETLDRMGGPAKPRRVIPPPLDAAVEGCAPADPRWTTALRARGETNFVCIGRLAPNKRQDRVMELFDHYHSRIDSRSRLHLVGDPTFDRDYTAALESRRRTLAAGAAIEITGHVSAPVLQAYHRTSDVHLCLSEHEGLCLPPLAAMAHGVPVFARAMAALPETLGEGAVLIHQDDPARAAELVRLVVEDEALRRRVVDAARTHLERYRPVRIRALWEEALATLRAL
jgi:glycosyltransferase involved in cell wall biosynthesis